MASPDASSQRRSWSPLWIGPPHRHPEVAAEFLCEIDRYSRVDSALSVQEFGLVVERHDRAVPNIWMNIKPAAAVTPERDELLWCHIVPRQGERHDETLVMQRIEQLAAIGMVIGAPDQRLLPQFCRAVGGRLFRPFCLWIFAPSISTC